jgi:branched-chain amino acid transport system substrate-binding protein
MKSNLLLYAIQVVSCILLSLVAPEARSQIRIGQTIDLSGSSAEHGTAVLKGVQAYLRQVNAAGGVNGQRIELITLDDGGKADKAAVNTRELVEKHQAIAIFSGIEGGPCVASLKVATELKVPQLACAAGAPELRDPFNRYSFPVRAAHLSEFETIIKLAKSFNQNRWAFVHSDSETGRKHLANVQRLCKENGVDLVAAIAVKSGDAAQTPESIAKEILASRANAVLNHGGYATYAKIFKALRAERKDVQFYAVNSGAQQMTRLLGEDAPGVVFTQVVPLPTVSFPRVIADYRAALAQLDAKELPSFSSLEGYLNARVLVAALRRAGPKPGSESLIRALEDAGTLDVDGFSVRYGKSSRIGSSFVDTVIARKGGGFRSH